MFECAFLDPFTNINSACQSKDLSSALHDFASVIDLHILIVMQMSQITFCSSGGDQVQNNVCL